LNKQIENTKDVLKSKIDETITKSDIGNVINEKNQLMNNINTISEELDNLSEKNNYLIDMLKCKEDFEEINRIKTEISNLKNQNFHKKNSLSLGNDRNNIFNRNYKARDKSSLFSCFPNTEEESLTINIRNKI
jgi:hypothetical protein